MHGYINLLNKHALLIIIGLALLLRFYQLGVNPPSLTWDEAAWGYNAYSLGIDGKDEFGRFIPLDYLESFGDFKPPMYAYLSLIPVKIFGLTEFSTRFASAFIGVLTVFVSYYLVKLIFYSSENKKSYALISSLLLSVSPWHINLSRAAFEANVATFFIAIGVYFFLRSMLEHKIFIVVSLIAFVFSMYTFNTARVVSPLLLFLLVVLFRNKLLVFRKEFLIACIIAMFILLPSIRFLMSPHAKLRFEEVNIFSNIEVVEESNKRIENSNYSLMGKILNNRRVLFSLEYLRHYFDNLNPLFLFIKGDGNPKFSTQDVGQLYLLELPFLVIGLLYLFRKKEGFWWIVPLWFILGIVPAATARETPHALRIETTLPMFQVLTGYGAVQFLMSIRQKVFLSVMLLVVLFISVLYYLHGYYAHYPREFSGEWQYGYKDAISYINKIAEKYDRIYFTNDLGRPYIYVLFYTEYSPEKFRKEQIVKREPLGFVHILGFDKFRFSQDLRNTHASEKVLYIDTPKNIPEGAKIMQKFYLLNKQPVLIAYEK